MLVLCNGMPRSGSTLQYNVVAGLVDAAGAGTAGGGIEDTGGTAEDLRTVAATDTMLVYKTHDVLPHVVPWLERGESGVFVCYIFRDLRDVAVSVREKHGPNDAEMFGLLDRAVAAYDTLVPLRESPHVLWQRYEDVIADPRTATLEAADLLGLTRRAVEHSIAQAAPSEVRQIRRGMRDGSFSAADPDTHIHWNHVSRFGGASGVWRRELPKPLLATITDRYADWFASAGYDIEDAGATTEGAGE